MVGGGATFARGLSAFWTIENNGLMSAQGGTLTVFAQTFTNNGTLEAQSGASLTLTFGPITSSVTEPIFS